MDALYLILRLHGLSMFVYYFSAIHYSRCMYLIFFFIPDMALQWTFVASFMYIEIAVVIMLLLPFVSPGRFVFYFLLIQMLEQKVLVIFSYKNLTGAYFM